MRRCTVASRRILIDTVTLYNYVGEVNDIATYQETVLRYCYCPADKGIGNGLHAKKPSESARLYLFDYKTVAESPDGVRRSYLPYSQWKTVENKEQYWTLNDSGKDYFVKEGQTARFEITRFSHKKGGTRRMWHFEVDAK